MFRKFYLYAFLSFFLLTAQNAWMMPFETAYRKLTSLMKEEYDTRVKDELGLTDLSDREVKDDAKDYFDAFYGVRYFLVGGKRRDGISLNTYVKKLRTLGNSLFKENWDIHTALMTELLNIRSILRQTGKQLDNVNNEIIQTKHWIRSAMQKHDTVDLDRVSPAAAAAASRTWFRKKLDRSSTREDRVDYLSFDPLF